MNSIVQDTSAAISAPDCAGLYPLSLGQERLWFLEQYAPGSSAYVLPWAIRLKGALDRTALERSLNTLRRRHEMLRTRLVVGPQGARQRIEEVVDVRLPLIDLRALNEEVRAKELGLALEREVERPFDLQGETAMRAALFRLGAQEHVLLVTAHHLAADAWSLDLISRQLGRLYEAEVLGAHSAGESETARYVDFAAAQRGWLNSDAAASRLAYWRRQLAGVPPASDFPLDFPRPETLSFRGDRFSVALERTLVERLRRLARQEGATFFTLMLAAYQTLLLRYGRQESVAVGTPVSGRSQGHVDSVVGFFANTVVIRADLTGAPTFREFLCQVRLRLMEALDHSDVPFGKVVEVLHFERRPDRNPLFQFGFSLGPPSQVPCLLGLETCPVSLRQRSSQVDLTLSVTDEGHSCAATWIYRSDLLQESTVRRLSESFAELLRNVADNPDQPLARLSLLPPAERVRLLETVARPSHDVAEAGTVLDLIREQVEARPDRVAVTFRERTMSYSELDRRANCLAAQLVRLGLSPGEVVGVCLERGLEVPAVLLGILRAGLAYLPLDTDYPPARLVRMLADACPRCVVFSASSDSRSGPDRGLRPETLAETAAALGEQIVPPAWLDVNAVSDSATAFSPPPVSPEHKAYVLFTSGSSGRPKGVAVRHRSLANVLRSTATEPGFSRSDVLVSVTPLSFDIASLELLLPLTVGGSVVLADADAVTDPRRLQALLRSSSATVMQATPSTWRLLVDSGWAGSATLRAWCGGEVLTPELAERLSERAESVWNLYGPTETTIWSTVHRVTRGESPVSIGRPISHTRVYVLDERLEPVPQGVTGELCIGGCGVALGYVGSASATNEPRFVPDPFSRLPARMYRTGDLARFRGDGRLEWLGRSDGQVKVRGCRIELPEIESVLCRHPSVREAAVVVRPGGTELAAFVRWSGSWTAEWELRRFLGRQLPKYMIPSTFTVLSGLPLTANGKVDRGALANLEPIVGGCSAESPTSMDPLQVRLARIWAGVLGRRMVGLREDFFELGGHSLLALRLIGEIEREFKRSLPLALLFHAPTVETFAARLRGPEESSGVSRSLIPLRAGKAPRSLFCMHPHPGGVLCYADLARNLAAEFDTFGLQARGLDGKGTCPSQVEEMAGNYLAEIRERQPFGPYYFAGFCAGGAIALEAAAQALARGYEVGLVLMIDSYAPGFPRFRPGVPKAMRRAWSWVAQAQSHTWILRRLSRPERGVYIRRRASGLLRSVRQRFECFSVLAKGRRGLGDRLSEPDSLERTQQTIQRAWSNHTPRFFPGPVILVRAQHDRFGTLPSPTLGWDRALLPRLQVETVPGFPGGLIFEPQVSRVASVYTTALRVVESR